ncbi:hypothetical protein ACTI_48370 [Actinoplanes sp. OR16]|uniref:hypothetical protein n=1 Tax=Actinoplanes sp. OR16 TaxID=946334 RepID=UPI000F6F2692|nr:hypothetical protein [Actinoplanes sp. OR16]BBH68152.1 hypothetical protein ACTI_48370 [Actinoplanes sp. OR16]
MTDDMPYGLARPTVDDIRAAVHRVHAGDGPRVWDQLVRTAGPDVTVERLLPAMQAADPTTRLCALALQIRVTAHTQLAAAFSTVRS